MFDSFSKKVLITTVALGALTLGSQASYAADPVSVESGFRPYISVFAGASFMNDVNTVSSGSSPYTARFNTGYIIGGAVGAKWNDMLRTELELSHSSVGARDFSYSGGAFSPASGNLNATYLLANVWLDVPTHSQITPYIGGGIGYGWANANLTFNGNPGYTNGTGGLAWQLGAGVKYSINEHLDFDLGYRYKALDNINFVNAGGTSYFGGNLRSHNIQLGLTYNF